MLCAVYASGLPYSNPFIKQIRTTLFSGITSEIIRFRQGEYRDSLNAFGEATDTDRIHKRWFNKSLGLVHLGKDTETLRALDKVLNLNPREKEAQSKRALIVRKM